MTDKHPTRRDFLTIAAGSFLITAFPIVRGRNRIFRSSLPVMGSSAEIAVVHHNEAVAFDALDAAHAELRRIERMMTRFAATSDIGRANARAGVERVPVSLETANVVERALRWAHHTKGAFDPAIARIVDLWDVTERHEPPPAQAVHRLAGRSLYHLIEVDGTPGHASLYVRQPDAAIDLGGIACGYAVDRAVAVLRERGIANGFVNVSGDIYTLGVSQRGEPWQVGVRSPSNPDQLIGQVSVSDGAIATSGDYEQGFTYRGRRYHHIMDPQTAEPRVTRIHSVTVTADHCIEADAATTAIFGLPTPSAQSLLNRCSPGARVVNAG